MLQLKQVPNNLKMLAINKGVKVIQFLTKTKYFSSSTCTYEEIKIPVPWGHIAGKWWGPQDKRPILGIHGVQDNCVTFDRIAPYLAPNVGLLAVDLPGHGLSSHLPPGTYHHDLDTIATIRRIVNYFNWSKVSLLGHSQGGATSYLYALFYPNTIDFLICLDCIRPHIFDDIAQIKTTIRNIDNFIKYDYLNNSQNEQPCYTIQELEEKLHEGTNRSLFLENCKCILQRNIAPSSKEEEKYYITRDLRLKVLFTMVWPKEFIFERTRELLCPIFMSHSNIRTSVFEPFLQADDLLEFIQKINKQFEFHIVNGTHHIHINNPERIEGIINNFIKKYDLEDRSVGGLNQDKLKSFHGSKTSLQ